MNCIKGFTDRKEQRHCKSTYQKNTKDGDKGT